MLNCAVMVDQHRLVHAADPTVYRVVSGIVGEGAAGEDRDLVTDLRRRHGASGGGHAAHDGLACAVGRSPNADCAIGSAADDSPVGSHGKTHDGARMAGAVG